MYITEHFYEPESVYYIMKITIENICAVDSVFNNKQLKNKDLRS